MKSRCLIYAHWDRDGIIDPHVIHALRGYRSAVERIVFVSTHYTERSPELENLADRVICRENLGFDFGSWQAGLESLEAATFDEVVCTNSSIYGPLWPIERVFESEAARTADLWGMTISQQRQRHLQSYFMGMSRKLLDSPTGRSLWSDIQPFRDKAEVITAYEIRWMDRCLADGFDVRAMFDGRSCPKPAFRERLANMIELNPLSSDARRYRRAASRANPNPTHMHWKQVLEAGVPFVKVDLFTRNPYGVPLSPVRRWLAAHTSYPLDLIRAHQARSAASSRAA
jgi:lipopolysaccharide biosynthesis protein